MAEQAFALLAVAILLIGGVYAIGEQIDSDGSTTMEENIGESLAQLFEGAGIALIWITVVLLVLGALMVFT